MTAIRPAGRDLTVGDLRDLLDKYAHVNAPVRVIVGQDGDALTIERVARASGGAVEIEIHPTPISDEVHELLSDLANGRVKLATTKRAAAEILAANGYDS